MATPGTQEKTVSLSYKTLKADLEASRKAIADLTKDLKGLDTQGNRVANTYISVGNNLKKASAQALSARNEILKGTQAIKDQTTALDRYNRALAAQQSGGAAGGTTGSVGKGLRLAGNVLGKVGVDTGLGDVGQIAQQVAPLIEGVGASLGQVAIAAPLAGVALVALSLAAKKFADDIEANKKRVDNAIGSQKTYYELLATGTSESIRLGLEELRVKLAVAEAVRRDIQAGQDQLKQFGILQGLAEQFTGLTDKAKQADDEIADTQAQIDALTRALQSNQVAANDARVAQEKLTEEARNNAQKIQAASKDIQDAQQRGAEQEAAIYQRASDRRIAIAQQTAEREEAAYTNLLRSLEDDRARLGQQQADARLDYQREEARTSRDHFRTLIKIRKDAEADEFELALNRDFAGLAKLRRDTDGRLSEEQERYTEERRQRLTALKQQLQDNQKAYVRERQQRIKQYNQQLQDIRQQQIREIKANDEATRIDLERLRARLVAELAMKQDAYSKLLELERQFYERRLAMAGQAVGSKEAINVNQPHEQKHPGTGGFARGGRISAGQTSMVNEGFVGQRESFTAGGKTIMLPGGMGLFTPAKSGTVNANAGGGGVSTGDIYAYGSNPRETAKIAGKIVEQKLIEAFEALTA